MFVIIHIILKKSHRFSENRKAVMLRVICSESWVICGCISRGSDWFIVQENGIKVFFHCKHKFHNLNETILHQSSIFINLYPSWNNTGWNTELSALQLVLMLYHRTLLVEYRLVMLYKFLRCTICIHMTLYS